MKNISKRIMALVLAVAMMITSLPTMASAEEAVVLKGQKSNQEHDYEKVVLNQEIKLQIEVENWTGRWPNQQKWTEWKDIKESDVQGKWTLYYKEGRGNGYNWEKIDNISEYLEQKEKGSNIPTKVIGGDAGYYWIKNDKQDNTNWYYQIEETKLDVKFVITVSNNELTVDDVKRRDFEESRKLKAEELDKLDNSKASNYVKTEFEKDDYKYTLGQNSNVTVGEDEEGNPVVTISAYYDRTPLPYFQTVNVNYQRWSNQRNAILYSDVIKENAVLGEKVECAKDAIINVKDYVKEVVEKNNKFYVLDEQATTVKGNTENDFANRERTVIITPVYKEDRSITIKYEFEGLKSGDSKPVNDIKVAKTIFDRNGKDSYKVLVNGYIFNEEKVNKENTEYTFKYRKEKDITIKYEPKELKIADVKVKESVFVAKGTDSYKIKVEGYVFEKVDSKKEGTEYTFKYRKEKEYTLKYRAEGAKAGEKLAEDVKVKESVFTKAEDYVLSIVGYIYNGFKQENDVYRFIYIKQEQPKPIEKVTLVHQLFYHEANGQGKYAIKFDEQEIDKIDNVDYKKADKVFNAYKQYAKEGYTLDEFYLGNEAIKYDEKENKIYFNYWARVIDIDYKAEGIALLKKDVRKVINFNDFEIINKDTDFTEWLNLNKLIDDCEVGGVWYEFDSYTKDLALRQSQRDDYCFVKLHVTYKKAKDAKHCDHGDLEYIDNNEKFNDAGHRQVCTTNGCDYVKIEKEDHEYNEDGVCVKCGHKRVVVEIYATKRSLSSFDDETMERIIREAKGEFTNKTDAYFEELNDGQWAEANLDDLMLTYTSDDLYDTTRTYVGEKETNGIDFKYILQVSLNQGQRRKKQKQTKIEDPLVAQGSELLNELRTVRPNDLITRAEFVGILANLFQVPEDRIYDKNWNLEDCEQRAQIEKYATYIIVKGYSDDEFGQNDTITTEQMYTIIARALKFQTKVKAMSDDEIKAELAKVSNGDKVADWAAEGVSIAVKVGIAAATETAPTEPQNGVMRITAADTLQKYIEIVAAPTGEAETKLKVVEG